MADVLWRDCANWLIRCQALPPDHRVTWANAQLIDLANTLRDGVLLCQLLNKLQPGCVDLKEMSLRPQMSQVSCESAHLDAVRARLEGPLACAAAAAVCACVRARLSPAPLLPLLNRRRFRGATFAAVRTAPVL
ncbi:hypothetical protein HPB48_003910 [Haemaphysalis longicornis]|uniref:Calponin-homology (CH) domain-containing protein n=1 Tax=Haemaphysalis longicornis TaxID=44386 RepID=A0A9J6FGD7_HAELO|nr:hypothetical protein HPB48_003910 [Haemaphysalis longicornis]